MTPAMTALPSAATLSPNQASHMTSHRSLYDILGIYPDATPEAIKAAFWARALEHHPDQNNGDPESELLFRATHAAYQTLSDPARKTEYDLFMRMGAVFADAHAHERGAKGSRRIAEFGHRDAVFTVLGLLNSILWDLDDIVRAKPGWNSMIQGIPVHEHVVAVLRFIDRWALEMTGFPDHFHSARGLAPPDRPGEIRSARHPGHRPYVTVDDYFFNVRVRTDRMISRHRHLDLMAAAPGTSVRLVDCILECHNYGAHYLGSLRAVLCGDSDRIAPFRHSDPCFRSA